MSDEIALVTGASSGIGAAYCRALAARCQRIIAVARRDAALRTLVEELSPQVEVVPVIADLETTEGVARALEALRQKGPVSLLVNNAGCGSFGRFSQLPVTGQQAMVGVHIDAVLSLCRGALPFMQQQGRGAIINVASVSALSPLAGSAVHAASKAFLVNFSLALQEEEAASGIRVQCLCPGPTRSGFHQAGAFEQFDPHAVPEALWMSPEALVTASLEALAADSEVLVVPGEANRAMALSGLQRQLDSLQ